MAGGDLQIRVILSKLGDLVKPFRQTGEAAKVTANDIRETNDKLRQLQKTQADLQSFVDLKKQLTGTRDKLAETKTALTTIGKAMAATDKPSKVLSTEFNRLKRLSEALTKQEFEQTGGLQGLRNTLAEAGISTHSLSAGQQALKAEVEATTKALDDQKEALKKQKQAAEAAALQDKKMQALIRQRDITRTRAANLAIGGAATLGGGVATLAPLTGAVDSASELQTALNNIASKIGLSADQSDRLRQNLMAMATDTNQLSVDLAGAADVLASAGAAADTIEPIVRAAARTATAEGARIEDLVNAAYAAVRNLGVPASEAARVMEMLTVAGKLGSVEIKDFAGSLPGLASRVQLLGYTGMKAVAAIAAGLEITARGAGGAEEATVNYQNVLNKITQKETVQNLAKFGVDLPKVWKKARKDGLDPLVETLKAIQKVTGGDAFKIGQIVSDQQAGAGIATLLQHLPDLVKLTDQISRSQGVVDADFARKMKEQAEAAKALNVSLDNLSKTIGFNLLPDVTELKRAFAGTINDVTSWAAKNPDLAKTLAQIAGIAAVLLIGLGGLAIGISAVLGPFALLRFTLASVGLAGWGALLPLLAWPLAIAGAIAAGIALYNHWNEIVAWFKSLDWAAIGAGIVGGIIAGIPGAAFACALVKMARAGIAAVKNELGIKSPSRVFMGIGDNVIEGLTGGIAGNTGPVDRLKRLSREMTAALAIGASVASPAGARLPGAGGLGGPGGGAVPVVQQVTITIQAAPGQSASDIAEAVKRALADQARQASVSARSAYADSGE